MSGALLSTAAHSAPPVYQEFYVFGDSLADIGNDLIVTQRSGINPPIPPSAAPHLTYYQGRFSNGPVAVEYLWWLLSQNPPGSAKALQPSLSVGKVNGHDAVSFAFGGAGSGVVTQTPGGFFVPGLKGQVALFRDLLRGKAPGKRALYVIIVGADDYLVPPTNVPAAPADAVANIGESIELLYAIGARDFIVLNLPDLGAIPLLANTPSAGFFSALSAQHNVLLADALTALRAKLAGTKIFAIDLNSAEKSLPPGVGTEQRIPALETFGFPFGVSSCLLVNPAACPNVPTFNVDQKFFYWDAEHPTTTVHRALGGLLFQALQQ
jgi:phospholipase/lecithinase/hemolysin